MSAGTGAEGGAERAVRRLIDSGQILRPLLAGLVLGLCFFLLAGRALLPFAGDPGPVRLLADPFCRFIAAVFAACASYALVQLAGLALDLRDLERPDGPPSPGATLLRFWGARGRRPPAAADAELRLAVLERQLSVNLVPVQFTIWALPLLGFLGTVVGISRAIGGLGQILAVPSSGSGDGLAVVLAGLRLAFDTTFVGLVLVLPAMALILLLRVRGEAVLLAAQHRLLPGGGG